MHGTICLDCEGYRENICGSWRWGKGEGADYVIPNFQLIRNQAESLDRVTIENLSKRACLSGPSALTERNKYSIAL